MVDALFLASVSILFILLIRKLFSKRVPARMVYALWLIPIFFLSLFLLPCFKVTDRQIMLRIGPRVGHFEWGSQKPVLSVFSPDIYDKLEDGLNHVLFAGNSFSVKRMGEMENGLVALSAGLSVWEILRIVWMAGAVLTAGILLVPFLRTWRHVRTHRTLYPEKVFGQRIYLVDGFSSSCLLGGNIYVDGEQRGNAVHFLHIVRHEMMHKRQGDDIWNVVRMVCVVFFWFHPLVWIAAWVSKTDSEYACDERVMKKMPEEERISYGTTLLELVTKDDYVKNDSLFVYGIDGGRLKERVERIVAKKPKGAGIKKVVFSALIVCLAGILLYVARCGIVRLVESNHYNTVLKYSVLPLSKKVVPTECTYQDGQLYTVLDSQTNENCEIIYKWLEYEENGEFALVMKNNLKKGKEQICVGDKEDMDDYRKAFHSEKGQTHYSFGEFHNGETKIYQMVDFLTEDFKENYPHLIVGEYRMTYVLCSHETGVLELLRVPFRISE